MKLLISNKATLTLPPNTNIPELEKFLTVENKDYFKQQKIAGFAVREWKFYKKTDDKFETKYVFPRGAARKAIVLFNIFIKNIEYDLVSTPLQEKIFSRLTLREYQKEIIEATKKNNIGMIVANTGSGKTVVSCEIIAQKQVKTTIIVPNNTLLHQWDDEIKKNLNYSSGIINGESKEIKDITICCVASLYNNEKILKDLVKNTGMLIWDEVQNSPSPKNRKIVQSFKPKYLYGLTATPYRGSDSFTPVLGFLFGREICNIKSHSVKPTVHAYKTNVQIPIREYPEMITLMTENEKRNDFIQKTIFWEAVVKKRKTLVLTKRKEHGERLYGYCKDLVGFYLIRAEDPERDFLLSSFKDGTVSFKCIIGTSALLGAGMDIPSLDTLIIACDIQSPVLLNQSSGRILRIFEGKNDPKIIDFYDNLNSILNKQFNERKKQYNHNGWEIIFN